MSEENKHIDELFRSAAAQSKAPDYNPSFWGEMEAMLNDSKKRRKGLLLWSSFGGVLMIGLVSALLLTLPSEIKYSQAHLHLEAERIESHSNNYKANFSSTTSSEISNEVVVDFKKQDVLPLEKASTPVNLTSPRVAAPENIASIESKIYSDATLNELPLLPNNLMNGLKSADLGTLIATKQLPVTGPLNVNIELGAGVSQAYNDSKTKPSIFQAMLKVDYKVKRFTLSSGLGLSVEQNPGITVSQRAQVFGFGVTDFEHSLNYKTLVDFIVPVQVAYQFGKNTFGIGAQARYLATSSMRFESKENGQTTMADNLNGITTGLNPFNIDTYGFYERSVSQKLSLGVRVNKQLTSRISNEEFFNNLERSKVINGQVYLKYTLFNH